jgi:hypothetical protein
VKKVLLALLFFAVYSLPQPVFADYVMPYPSYMPGNTLYRISRVLDKLKNYWSWGNIAQVKYHLGLSDKYLIEAKTLMEYKQYLLGANALTRSDDEFGQIPVYLQGAKNEGVDILQLQNTVAFAAEKHVELLNGMLSNTPAQFLWTPEKAQSTALPLGAMVQTSIGIRQKIEKEIW